VVPVERQARATQVGADREAEPLPAREGAVALLEARGAGYPRDTLLEAAARDPQVVDGLGVWRHEVLAAQLEHRDPQPLGDGVEMALERETRLRCPVPTLRAAGWLVGQHPHALPPISRQRVADRLERPGVVQGGGAVAGVRAAIQVALEIHGLNPAVARPAGLDPHQHRVAAAMAVEDLLT